MGGAAIAPPTSLVEKDKECTYLFLPLSVQIHIFNPVVGSLSWNQPGVLSAGKWLETRPCSNPQPSAPFHPLSFIPGSEAWVFLL